MRDAHLDGWQTTLIQREDGKRGSQTWHIATGDIVYRDKYQDFRQVDPDTGEPLLRQDGEPNVDENGEPVVVTVLIEQDEKGTWETVCGLKFRPGTIWQSHELAATRDPMCPRCLRAAREAGLAPWS